MDVGELYLKLNAQTHTDATDRLITDSIYLFMSLFYSQNYSNQMLHKFCPVGFELKITDD